MSSDCGNCDCADKSQCIKKGNTFQVDGKVESGFKLSSYETMSEHGENDCKCGPGCTCTTCGCHK